MSPHPYSIETEIGNDDCHRYQDDIHGRSTMGENDEQRAEDESDSKDEAWKQDTTVQDSNALNEYVPDKNYGPEWMEMDGDYNQNIKTELRWTYFK